MGTAGCDIAPVSRTWSRRTREVVAGWWHFPTQHEPKKYSSCNLVQGRLRRGDHSVSAELPAREGSPSFRSSSSGAVQSCRQLLPETSDYPTKVFSPAPYWQTGETKTSQCRQIWWKAEEILHVNRITPAREEERSPISLSYLTLQSAVQQYYLLCDKRAFYPNMMWSSFAWKISSVFSKILLVSRRENGDYTSKPWASTPIARAFVQHGTNAGGFLNCSTRTIPFLCSECLLELGELSPLRQGPL